MDTAALVQYLLLAVAAFGLARFVSQVDRIERRLGEVEKCCRQRKTGGRRRTDSTV